VRDDSDFGKIYSVKRLRRWLFNGLAILSLALCVGRVVLWFRSTDRKDILWYNFYPATADTLPHKLTHYSISTAPRSIDVCREPEQFGLDVSREDGWTPGLFLRSYEWIPGLAMHYATNDHARIEVWGPAVHKVLGFGWDSKAANPLYGTRQGWRVSFPIWYLTVFFGILPSAVIWSKFRRRRYNHLGYCVACGYDLRATPNRCPECGAIPTSVKSTM
jgi:hypothetical protein